MTELSIRFGITDGKGYRASTWKCWARSGVGKSDVYIACRALGGRLKVSLHESGEWHYSYSPRFFAEGVKGAIAGKADRFISRWYRPREIALGVTLPMRIVTPWSAVISPIDRANYQSIIWIPNATEDQATEIDIIVTAPGTPVTGWPAMRSMGTKLVDSVPLDNGETVWVVYRATSMPDLSHFHGALQFYRGRCVDDLDSDGLRAIVFRREEDGSRVLYDCAVEK